MRLEPWQQLLFPFITLGMGFWLGWTTNTLAERIWRIAARFLAAFCLMGVVVMAISPWKADNQYQPILLGTFGAGIVLGLFGSRWYVRKLGSGVDQEPDADSEDTEGNST